MSGCGSASVRCSPSKIFARRGCASSLGGTFTAATFKDRSGVGRNLTIQILEYLDKMGATRRQGDARIVVRGSQLFT